MIVTSCTCDSANPAPVIRKNLALACKFAIDSFTGDITFVNVPDFEANASFAGSNLYNLIVQAVDNGGVPSDLNVSVELTDDNDAPSIEAVNNGSTSPTVSI